MLIMGKTIHVWGQGTYGKSLYLPLNFTMILKLLLKKQSRNWKWAAAASAIALAETAEGAGPRGMGTGRGPPERVFFFLFFPSLFFWAVWLTVSWCSGQVSGLSLWRWESWVQGIGPPETSRPHVISNSESSARDLHLNAKTQLHSTTNKLHCWTPYVKQVARQEHNPTH